MPDERKGAWIQTVTGRSFWPCDPRVEDIDILDIAHALSHLCRFGGHVRPFYSVADHSLFVSRICDPADALWGLLHDASEAYLVDLPRPIKKLVEFSAYRAIEAGLMRVVCEKFGLPLVEPESVRHADLVALATEARDLMQPPSRAWNWMPEPHAEVIVPSDPIVAREEFLLRFEMLSGMGR